MTLKTRDDKNRNTDITGMRYVISRQYAFPSGVAVLYIRYTNDTKRKTHTFTSIRIASKTISRYMRGCLIVFAIRSSIFWQWYVKKKGERQIKLHSKFCFRCYYPKETMEEAGPYINYNKPCNISSTCGMPVTKLVLVCVCVEARI